MNRRTASTALSAVCSAAAGAALLAGASPAGTAAPGTTPEGTTVSAARHPDGPSPGTRRTRVGPYSATAVAAGPDTTATAPASRPAWVPGHGPVPEARGRDGRRWRGLFPRHRPTAARDGHRLRTGLPGLATVRNGTARAADGRR